jgi:hypothetical protein
MKRFVTETKVERVGQHYEIYYKFDDETWHLYRICGWGWLAKLVAKRIFENGLPSSTVAFYSTRGFLE